MRQNNQSVRCQKYSHIYAFYLEKLVLEGVKVRGVKQ